MSKVATQIKRQENNSWQPASGFLQRRCDCGNHTSGGGSCGECSKNELRTAQTKLGAAPSVSSRSTTGSLARIEVSAPAERVTKADASPVAHTRQRATGFQVGTKPPGDMRSDDPVPGPTPPETVGPVAPTPIPATPAPATPAPAACVRPNNFTHTNPRDHGVDAIRVDLAWGSTSGNVADLGHCRFREVVDYDPIPNPPFLWNPPNPTIIEWAATGGTAVDTHSYPPGLRTGITNPRELGTMTAHQVYQVRCTGTGCPGTWENIPGQAYTITREVTEQFVRTNPWRYIVTKTGVNFSRDVEIPEP
jgi:hypothetical protein